MNALWPVEAISAIVRTRGLPPVCRQSAIEDIRMGLREDPGPRRAIEEATAWLCRAQDNSPTEDGGVARDYSLVNGWTESYPETTGYIVPTMIAMATYLNQNDYLDRARRMLDWLAAIQLDGGGFQGGKINATPIVPVTFNTGQILLGLAAGYAAFGAYEDAMHRAAQWLVDSQDNDGAWRRFPTPFAKQGEKAYETHVSWGLFEAERVAPDKGYGAAGLKQVDWALTKQKENGWVGDCCLSTPQTPLTHTLGYCLKGFVEAHRLSLENAYYEGAVRLADGLLSAQRPDGAMPGQLKKDWSPAASWSCLTGNVQVADSWFYLFDLTGDRKYLDAARAANCFVRRTMVMDGPDEITGAVAGSFPISGGYGTFEYLNWAAKFLIDSNVRELEHQNH